MQALFGLEGKRIVVLGGGQGMGEATVRLLTSLGASVAVVDIVPERAERVATAVQSGGGTALAIDVDITDDEALIAAIDKVGMELGPLDGMASIVGMAAFAPSVDMPMEVWDTDHRRNLRCFFLAAREVARGLLQRGAPGSIVGVASVNGIGSSANTASYGAAKAGLINLVRSLAVEWSGRGIRVNAVAPGPIITPRVAEQLGRMNFDVVPMARPGSVDDIAKAITFFLSELSPYVTGQTLAVDGGYTLATPDLQRPRA